MISRRAALTLARTAAAAFGLLLVESLYADTANEPIDQIPEVIVTATKRESTVQETAASITAVSAEDIADRGLVDFNSLAQTVPGISMRTSGPGQTEFEMRGLNSAGGNTSQVGFYLDETPLSSPASSQLGKEVIDPTLYDLSRVEVLRGPQGTLYGSSSMGGTVKIVPNAPEPGVFTASGEGVTSYTGSGGSINTKLNGMVNLPIGDTAAFRIVGSEISDSGWIKRLVIQDGAVGVDPGAYNGVPPLRRPSNFYTAPLQEEVDGANSTTLDAVRASILWKPLENLSIMPMVMWQLTQQDAPDAVDVDGVPTHPTVPSELAHWEIYDSPEPQRDRFTLGSLKIEYELPSFSITSATGDWNRNTLVSQDSSEENAAAIGIPVYDAPTGIGPTGPAPNGPATTEKDFTRQFSEELRATSTGSGPFQWILGYFYQDLYSEWDEWSIAPQATPALGGTNLYVDYQPQTIIQNSEFGEASWEFLQGLKGTVGVRHYHYSLSQTNEEYGVFTVNSDLGDTVPYNTAARIAASGTDPKFDVSYNIDKDILVYATAAKGFRLGGANQPIPVANGTSTNLVLKGNECALQSKLLLQPVTACNPTLLLQAPATFDSDWVWNYEVGEKAAFLDHRLIANVSAYFERWMNPQIATNLSGYGITANGANAHPMSRLLHRSIRTRLPVAVGGRGLELFDSDGNAYLDASAGAAVSCLGHGHPAILAALHEQLDLIAYAHTGFFTTDIAERLGERLVAQAPGHIIARRQSYHGSTLGALSAGGNEQRRTQFKPLLIDTHHIDPCYAYRFQRSGESDRDYAARAAQALEEEIVRLGGDTVIAFVAETVVGATSGAVPPVADYLQRIRSICDRYGVLLILDEVMCGMGRTGTLHACEQDDVVPDLLTIAKGLGAGYQPIGAVLLGAHIFDAFRSGSGFFQHGHTYMGHPMAAAAALVAAVFCGRWSSSPTGRPRLPLTRRSGCTRESRPQRWHAV